MVDSCACLGVSVAVVLLSCGCWLSVTVGDSVMGGKVLAVWGLELREGDQTPR